LHLPLVLLGVAWLYRKHKKWALPCLVAALGLVTVAIDAFVYEPHMLVTSTYEVKAPSGAHIVVMSDFQASRIGDYERSVLQRVAALNPELLLLAGDYIQVYGERRAEVVSDFRNAWEAAGIHPRLGVFAVRGDVELDGWQEEIFGGLGVVTSDETKTLSVGDLTLTLLSLRDSANPRLALSPSSATSHIVLGHHPDFALGSGPAGLLVAGHTHGGQVQLPFWGPPFTLSSVPRQWGAGGLHAVDAERSLLVTRGAGLEHADDAPPLRFNCRPEIVALDMTP
jgi:predicted MPP superfamily phosphohydrolase